MTRFLSAFSRFFAAWLLVMATGSVSVQASWAAPSFVGLGDLPGGDILSVANAVSTDGSTVVGYSSVDDTPGVPVIEAVRWTSSGGMVGLGFLDVFAKDSRAFDVSSDGSAIVGTASVSATGTALAFMWTEGGGMTEIAFVNSSSRGISDDGSAAVGTIDENTNNEPTAVRWMAGGSLSLGYLPGVGPGVGIQSSAGAVSADGSTIVGASTNVSGAYEAYRWTQGGGMEGLGNLGGNYNSSARDVSADGSVIVGASFTAVGWEAFRWTSDGGMIGLGDLPGGVQYSIAYGVSGDGSSIVGWSDGSSGIHAFVWDETHGMRDLEAVLVGLGLDLTDWTLTNATGISGDGSVIVGYGTNPNGDVEAWMAVLSGSPAVPTSTPVATALLAALLGVAGWWRVRATGVWVRGIA